MIQGVVSNREARIMLNLRGPRGQIVSVEVVIDTGFTAYHSLPAELIEFLELDWQGTGRGTLADGSECLFDMFFAEVEWDGGWSKALVDEAETDPLIGMALLAGYELVVECVESGNVRISTLKEFRPD